MRLKLCRVDISAPPSPFCSKLRFGSSATPPPMETKVEPQRLPRLTQTTLNKKGEGEGRGLVVPRMSVVGKRAGARCSTFYSTYRLCFHFLVRTAVNKICFATLGVDVIPRQNSGQGKPSVFLLSSPWTACWSRVGRAMDCVVCCVFLRTVRTAPRAVPTF